MLNYKIVKMKFSKLTLLLGLILLTAFQAEAQEKAPDFQLMNLEGKQVALEDMLDKGPIVLDFWATWCKPCVKYMPKIQNIHEKYEDAGVIVLGINQDGPRSQSKVKPFIKSMGITFPTLIDNNNQVLRKYSLSSIPSTILISPEGKIVKVHKGYRPGDEKRLEAEIEKLLKKYKDTI